MTKKIRTNPNGNLTELQLLQLVHNGDIDNYMRKHNLIRDKCPPYHLIDINQTCTYCTSCFQYAISRIKPYKNYYKIGNKKYLKSELEE